MKNKISLILALTLVFSIAIVANAANNTVSGQGQAGQQVQVSNQGEVTQVQVQTSASVSAQGSNSSGQNASDAGTQAQNQNMTQNQGEDSQLQNREQENESVGEGASDEQARGEERRSEVSNAVQAMLQVAERNGGIGEQVRVIAQAQNENQVSLEASLEKVQKRSGVTKFFFGPNYGEISRAEKILEQNREQIAELNEVMTQVVNQADLQNLTLQVQTLEEANVEVENLLNEAEEGFALLGWMFKLFSR